MNKNSLQVSPNNLSASPSNVLQNANKILNVEKIDNMKTGDIHNTTILVSNSNHSNVKITGTNNHEYYNLFVVEEDFSSFGQGHFTIIKKRALTEYMSPHIKDKVDILDQKAINTLQTFPSIFCSENDAYGTCSEEQLAYLGMITGICVQDNGIKINYQLTFPIPQILLNKHHMEFGIEGTTHFNELNRTHWCVKKIDVIEVLHDLNIQTSI